MSTTATSTESDIGVIIDLTSVPQEKERPRHYRPRASRWTFTKLPLSLLVIAIPMVVFGVRLAMSLPSTFTSGGDAGFIEISVRQVLHGGTTLGAYSRYGWHHPGPAFLYLFAPIYWLSNENSRALFLDSWLLNSGCALLSVWLLRRRISEGAARVASVVLLAYMYAIGHFPMTNPWNPVLLTMPTLLFLTAAACAAAGSISALAIAFVSASFLVQTHIGTVPVAAVGLLVATIACVARRRALSKVDQTPGRPFKALIFGALILGVMWAPPLVQQFTSNNGNLGQIVRFYANPPTDKGPASHGLNESASVVSDYSTVVPWGTSYDTIGHRYRLLAAAGFGLLGIAVGVVAWRRNRAIAWCGLFGSLALLVAVAATSRVIGPFYGYLFTWTVAVSALPVFGACALILMGIGRLSGRLKLADNKAYNGFGIGVSVLVLALVAGSFTNYLRQADLQSFRDSPQARDAADKIETLVNHDKTRTVNLKIIGSGFDDGALILQLDKDGYSFNLSPEMNLYDGTAAAAPGGPTFYVGLAAQARDAIPGQIIQLDDEMVLTVAL